MTAVTMRGQLARAGLQFAVAAVIALWGTGCLSPSLRYTRDTAVPVPAADDSAAKGCESSAAAASPDAGSSNRATTPGTASGTSLYTGDCDAALIAAIDPYMGAPYARGGTSVRGIDCSGLVVQVFRAWRDTVLPRTSKKLSRCGVRIPPARARCGDLVFFRTGMFNTISHVGIMTGSAHFVHASRSSGVIRSSLQQEYYNDHFAFIKRVRE